MSIWLIPGKPGGGKASTAHHLHQRKPGYVHLVDSGEARRSSWQAGQVHPGRREDGKLWEGREGGGGGDGEVVGAGGEEGLEAFVALPPSLSPVRLDRGLQLRWLAEVLLC